MEYGAPRLDDEELGADDVTVRHPSGDLIAEPLQSVTRKADIFRLRVRERRRLDTGQGARARDIGALRLER